MNPREFQLLLYSARSRPDAASIRALVNDTLDWEALLRIAEQHGVRPMLLRSLKSVCWDLVPKATRLELEEFYRLNAQRNLFFAAELLRLIPEFQQNGIPIVAFKGAVLAESLYGDLSLREFSDLDVLVHEADLCKAEGILTARGYEPDFPDNHYRTTFLSYQREYAFRQEQTCLSVDLHWQLSSKGVPFPLRSAEVWPRIRQVTIGGHSVPTLAQDDLALFLAAHGTKEGWRRLSWVCDFAEFLRQCQDIDWAALLVRAHRYHSSRPLLLAILLAATLLDAPAPAELLNEARNNSAIRSLAKKARFRMDHPDHSGELGEFLNSLNTYDRLMDRVWSVAMLLTTRTVGDHQAMPLPKPLWGIYYVTRPFRLATKAAEMMLCK